MPQGDPWTVDTNRRRKAREWMLAHTRWPTACAKCGRTLGHRDPWVTGHIIPRAARQDLIWTPSNWQVECRPCSDKSGPWVKKQANRAKRNPEADDIWHEESEIEMQGEALGNALGNARFSRPGMQKAEATRRNIPRLKGIHAITGEYQESSPHEYEDVPWIADLLPTMRAEDVWPRLMTSPHPKATGSYGPEAVARIEARRRADPLVPAHEKALRFFQRLIVHRALEHDSTGALVWQTLLTSTGRQQGKSVLLRELAVARGAMADRLGEEQLVVHLARDLSVAEEVQRPARIWCAMRRQDGDRGYRAVNTNGKVECSGPGWRWVSRSEKGAYGWSASLALADECWDIEPATIHNGLEPTMAARREPQLWLISTAHESATGLVPEFRNRALGELQAPGDLLLVEWSARPDGEDGDPAGWRAASPWFDGRRRELIGAKVGRHGFREQWLNIWPEQQTRVTNGDPLISGEAWEVLEADPVGPVAGVAVEASAGLAPVVAEARVLPDLTVVVSCRQAETIAEAASWCREAGVQAVVGKSLLHDPAWTGLDTVPKTQTSASACAQLRQLVAEGALQHDGGDLLADQVTSTTVTPSTAGLRITSQGRTDAVKAAVWAAEAARTVPERPMIW